MRVTLIEWAITVTFICNVTLILLGVLFGEGDRKEEQQPKQTQSAPAFSTDEIKSDWK